MSTHYLSRFPGPKESQKATNTRREIQVAAGMLMVILLHGCAAMLFLRAWIPSWKLAPQHGMGIGVCLLEFLWGCYLEGFTLIGKFNVSIVFWVWIGKLIDCSGRVQVIFWLELLLFLRNFCFKFQKIVFQLKTRRNYENVTIKML